jgi:phosphoribosylaminoimidazole-succinocarboxamide synthase
MEKKEMLYEGKAKKAYKTDDPEVLIVDYKDDATAFNGIKKGTITGKGVINNRMTNLVLQMLEQKGIKTHYIKELSDRETAVRRVNIVPLEVIVRNIAAGSFSKRYGVEEGSDLKTTILEYSYKNDELGDPLINDYHALALGLVTREELDKIAEMTFKINGILKEFFLQAGIILVDFKIEFGRCPALGNEIILADEISPDTCRLWDSKTREKLDKDRFRRDLGNVEEAYQEIFKRMGLQE